MAQCQIQTASTHAFPKGSASVEDRRMTLQMNCREPATYTARMLGAANGRSRVGSSPRDFLLCENHAQLVAQVDRELVEEGWATSLPEKPQFLA
jgi:hypothetical protein